MSRQPATDDGAGAADAAPAMHVHRLAGLEMPVNRIQRRLGQFIGRRNALVSDREPLVRRSVHQVRVGLQAFVLLGEVDERRDAGVGQPRQFFHRR